MSQHPSYSKAWGKPHKNKRELAARIDRKLRELKLHHGPDEFDPIELLAIMGAEAFDQGDVQVAIVALREVAQYVRPKLAPKQAEAAEEEPPSEASKKLRIMSAFRKVGVQLKEIDPAKFQAFVEDAMESQGMSYGDAVEYVRDALGVEPPTQALPAPDP